MRVFSQRVCYMLAAAPVVLLRLLGAEGIGAPVSWGSELVVNRGDYTIQNWQVEQGLPQISVVGIAQTGDGYLWLATFNGLVRFDGVRFTVFNQANTPALSSRDSSIDDRPARGIVDPDAGRRADAVGRWTVHGVRAGTGFARVWGGRISGGSDGANAGGGQ
jgi:hypothetical protein